VDNEHDYPTTIITTRYQGVYEAGRWAALDCSFDEVPAAAIGSDVECAEFWSLAQSGSYELRDLRAWIERPETVDLPKPRMLRVGTGDSPEAALSDLRRRRSGNS
jgi:hypothetical protein